MRGIVGGQPQQRQELPAERLELVFDPVSGHYRNGQGQFVSDDAANAYLRQIQAGAVDAYHRQDLQLKLMRGEIGMEEFVEKSGVLEKVLDKKITESWAEASE
jgi:hypothetical protein